MKRVALIGAVLALAIGAPAEADEVPLHLPMIESLEPVARSYWAQRGVTLPEPVEVFLLPEAEGADWGGWGEEPGHRIWLSESVLLGSGSYRRVLLCTVYLHERGHNAGLSHESPDPVMAADPWDNPTPPKCFRWAETGFRAALRR